MKKIWLIFSAIIGILASIIAIVQFYDQVAFIDLNGKWLVKDTIKTGPYKGNVIEFIVFINQNGNEFTGEGEKLAINGKQVPQEEKSRLNLKSGVINAKTIKAIFIEYGRLRETRGNFVWHAYGKNMLKGNFSSTASSSGTSVASRINN